jgi:hypothetical protein
MAKEHRSSDTSLIAVLRTEIRERPVLLASFALFVCLVSFLIQYPEIRDPNREAVWPAENASKASAAPVESRDCSDDRSVLDVAEVAVDRRAMICQLAWLDTGACGAKANLCPKASEGW